MKHLYKIALTITLMALLSACGSNNNKGGVDSDHGLINTPPVAQSQSITIAKNKQLSITLKATDTNQDKLSYRITTPPKHGKLSGNAPILSYTPTQDYTGSDSFTFVANDGTQDSNEAKVSIAIESSSTSGGDNNTSAGNDDDNNDTGSGTDNNTTTGGSTDDNGTTGGGDSNSTSGTDDNTTGGSNDNNASTGDDNSTAGGSDTDNNATGGGTTTTLKSLNLTIAKTTLNKDHNTTLTLQATYDDNTTKTPTNVEWLIIPNDAVRIKGNTLTALKDTNVTIQAKVGNTLSNKVHLAIYWEVNGYRLPPEPDPKVNNATLLGVDVNHNGVRDDVERWIYKTYKEYVPCHQIPDGNTTLPSGRVIPLAKIVCEDHPVPYHPVVREAVMEIARQAQIIIQKPENAGETVKGFTAAFICAGDISRLKDKNGRELAQSLLLDDKFEAIQFNTVQRARAYAKFNYYLSGGVFESPSTDYVLKNWCSPKIREMIKDLK